MLTGLLGHRISYSASPALQAAAFRATGLDWTYGLLDVDAEGLGRAVETLREPGWAGANVTIPHKVSVLPLLDEVDAQAQAVGAVNLICNRRGRLLGSNTDVDGVRAALKEVGISTTAGLQVVILGAGGSARACAAALEGASITWISRRPAPGLEGRHVAWSEPGWGDTVRQSDLVINATPLGRSGELPFAAGDLPRHGAVIDLVYAVPTTPLVAAARAAGAVAADGWTVLLGQGAASFTAWTGHPAPLAAMREALPA